MAHGKPLIVQSDRSLLLEVDNPGYAAARDDIAAFAELEKSPEYVHTYRISPLSLWNAASLGLTPQEVVERLDRHARFPVPPHVRRDIAQTMGRFGQLQLVREGDDLWLRAKDPLHLIEIGGIKALQKLIDATDERGWLHLAGHQRGALKQVLLQHGWPVEDLAGYRQGPPVPFGLRQVTLGGRPFGLRPYQHDAAAAFHAGGTERGGAGVVVLPCGAGKTVVALAAMARVSSTTLILTTNVVAVRQWIREILDKTDLDPSMVGEYTGHSKEIRPITLATYQIVTWRPSRTGDFPHFGLFHSHPWGLIVYDEVHLLPAPVFRVSAEVQATRRLGLTATLVREDGRESDVFSLIGPKRYDVPWKDLEGQGWIASATCTEHRIPLPTTEYVRYAQAADREKVRIAAENPYKVLLAERLLERHEGEPVLLIGQYLSQLDEIRRRLELPLITGQTPQRERERLYTDFRDGRIPALAVSKVGNFAIDLPEASVLIQVSGTFGSRQEEAQRLGRILRPKEDGRQAHFHSLVTRDTREQDFAMHRQLFLAEQGYSYRVEGWEPGMP